MWTTWLEKAGGAASTRPTSNERESSLREETWGEPGKTSAVGAASGRAGPIAMKNGGLYPHCKGEEAGKSGEDREKARDVLTVQEPKKQKAKPAAAPSTPCQKEKDGSDASRVRKKNGQNPEAVKKGRRVTGRKRIESNKTKEKYILPRAAGRKVQTVETTERNGLIPGHKPEIGSGSLFHKGVRPEDGLFAVAGTEHQKRKGGIRD